MGGKQWDAYLDTGNIPYDAFEIVEDGDCGGGTRVETREGISVVVAAMA